MALYKYDKNVQKSEDAAFDAVHQPGIAAPYAGIYKCVVCGHEIGIASGHTLPTQGHAQHDPKAGKIEWKLAVYAVHSK